MALTKAASYGMITWIVRILTGATFVVSGFVKAIDPWGFLYKSEEYLSAFSLTVWPNLLLVGVFGLCALEFLIGIFLISGCFRRSVAVMVLTVMCFMLPLTLWLVISDPVDDCGCFGEAFKISNWASFWKNVALTIAALWLLKHNKTCSWLVTPALQWLVFLATSIYILTIELFGYVSQPLIDFRPYKTGTELLERTSEEAAAEHYLFTYEKDGERKTFREDEELPSEEDGWVFVDRIEVDDSDKGHTAGDSGRNLRLWSRNGNEDVTEDVISEDGKELLVMMPELSDVSPATTWKINSLFEWAEAHDVKMIGVVSGSTAEIESWLDISMASYPVYSADDTQIKEVVRGNPSIVYLENGVVAWKSTLTALNIDDFMSPEISDDARNFGLDNIRILRNASYIYLIAIMALVVMSFIPRLKRMYFRPASAASEESVERENQE